MGKRTRDLYDRDSPTPSSPPAKRAHAASSPIRPRPRASSSFSTPFAYSLRTPLSVPQDSPTNPFGLKRSLAALELPRATSFGKHICLRFQLCDDRFDRAILKRKDRDGIFRIVQVPLNYSFRHIHKLILYLFASDITDMHSNRVKRAMRNASAEAKGKGRARGPGQTGAAEWGGHFFEVFKSAKLYRDSSPKYGMIMPHAKLRHKLSSVRERRLFRDLLDPDNADAEENESPLPKALEDEDEDNEDWSWEAEDDFTLAQVYTRGAMLDRGIVYHHQPHISVHITANTLPVPSRRGTGNEPFVFEAQGSAGGTVRIAHTVPTADGGEAAFDLSRAEPQFDGALPKGYAERWNAEGAFLRFLSREAHRERALQRHAPAPAAIDLTASPSRASSEPPSEDEHAFPMSEPGSDASELSSASYAYSDSALYPLSLSAVTPYPAHPLHRKRVRRAERRMERLTKSGLSEMLSSDEEDAKKKGKKADKGKGKATEEDEDAEYEDGGDAEEEEGEGEGDDDANADDAEEDAEEVVVEEVPDDEDDVVEISPPIKILQPRHGKENYKIFPKVYRPVKAYMRGGARGGGISRSRKVVMDLVEWTPAGDDDGYRPDWGSVEV
ncbi:hypothetical protein PsYK624_026730 [Phanerochaete sordida]|uniref:Uncharacterized protein n=1 Tax=Phanerochaete sordida TaxID=48140 RepID=A0A9P3LA34_9APHY|nr:hypothetical protein PsYK624_026730 [Phanerochaete sordida]